MLISGARTRAGLAAFTYERWRAMGRAPRCIAPSDACGALRCPRPRPPPCAPAEPMAAVAQQRRQLSSRGGGRRCFAGSGAVQIGVERLPAAGGDMPRRAGRVAARGHARRGAVRAPAGSCRAPKTLTTGSRESVLRACVLMARDIARLAFRAGGDCKKHRA